MMLLQGVLLTSAKANYKKNQKFQSASPKEVQKKINSKRSKMVFLNLSKMWRHLTQSPKFTLSLISHSSLAARTRTNSTKTQFLISRDTATKSFLRSTTKLQRKKVFTTSTCMRFWEERKSKNFATCSSSWVALGGAILTTTPDLKSWKSTKRGSSSLRSRSWKRLRRPLRSSLSTQDPMLSQVLVMLPPLRTLLWVLWKT